MTLGGVHVIGNPLAGRGVAGKAWTDLLRLFDEAGAAVTAELTERAGHAVELARRAREGGADLVVAAGGDGTVHEVVNGLLADGEGPGVPVLGVLPLGSGCDYVKTFGAAADPLAAVRRLVADEPPRLVDIGEVRCRRGETETVRYFANIAEVGIGSEVVARATRLPRVLGGAMYFVAFWMTLSRFERRSAVVRMDQAGYEGKLLGMVVAVGQVFGGGMRIAPHADPGDGLFDVQVHHGSKVDYMRGIAKVYRGTHLPHPRIREERASVVEVTCTPPGLIEADGEVVGTTPAVFRVLPSALRLKV